MQPTFEKVLQPHDRSFLCYRRTDRAFDFQWHYHPEYELTLIVRSKGTRFVGDSIDVYREGDLALIGPNLPHTWCSHTHQRVRDRGVGHEAIGVQFRRDFLGQQFFDAPELSRVAALLDEARRGVSFDRRAAQRAASVLADLPEAEPDNRLVGFLRVLRDLSRASPKRPLATAGYDPSLRPGNSERTDRVCRYLTEQFCEEIDHAHAARLARMSPQVFCRFFKNSTGKTVTQYVNELRVGLACRLLIETDLTVTEICYRVGFNNFANFTRRFKAVKRISPGRFRTRYLSRGSGD